MKEKTINEIASMKRVQDAFLEQYNATPEERTKPKVFTANKIVEHIKHVVETGEERIAVKLAQENYQANKTELV